MRREALLGSSHDSGTTADSRKRGALATVARRTPNYLTPRVFLLSYHFQRSPTLGAICNTVFALSHTHTLIHTKSRIPRIQRTPHLYSL